MEGGATLHGPQPRDYTEHVNRKVKRLALKVALSDKVRNNSFSVISVDNLDKGTKAFVSCVNSLGSARTRLVGHVDAHGLSPVYLAARNVHGHAAVSVDELNAENVLRYEHLILTEKALEKLVSRLRSGRK
jgi:large subunit ribosomal protein L4